MTPTWEEREGSRDCHAQSFHCAACGIPVNVISNAFHDSYM
jgi:hypothetical protein